MPLPEPLIARDTAASPRWLSIVGIGEDGVEGLSAVARGLIGAAEIVFGGRRHLALAAPLIRGAARPWPSPFDGAADEVLRHRGRQVCVLASGDPFHYGVGAVLARHVDAREMIVVPAPSAFSLAAARLGWSLPRHGAAVAARPRARSGPSASAARRAHPGADLRWRRAGRAGRAAGRQRLRRVAADRARSARRSARAHPRDTRPPISTFGAIDPLNTVAIEVEAAPDARVLARTPGPRRRSVRA